VRLNDPMIRDNAEMVTVGRFLVVLVAACSTGCGASDVRPAAPGPSSNVSTVATSSAAAATASSASSAGVPPVSAEARAAGFIDVRTAVPNAIINLRYATPNNFVGTPLYPPTPAAWCMNPWRRVSRLPPRRCVRRER